MKNVYQKLLIYFLLLPALSAFAQVPLYNSYLSGSPTIFLDFDGQTVSGTQWNSNGTIVAGPANLNEEQIREVFNRIAEDYRPFNINVTTDSTQYFAAPPKQRMRVIFTISHGWYDKPVGGIAYTNSFTWGDNTPCWVFTAALNYNVKNISEAGAHEAGHTLGLRHQASYDANCTKLSDYNSGTGSGEIGWAPIMGLGYSKNFTTWNLGPNSTGCTTLQNDLSIITRSATGVQFRPDDHGATFGEAASVTTSGDLFQLSGVITTSDDQDMFRFSVPSAGRFQLQAIPFNVGAGNRGANLDLQVRLYNEAHEHIGSYNPAPYLSSVVDTILEGGNYFLAVEGKGNQFAAEYGSLGSYALEGKHDAFRVLPLQKLELKGGHAGGLHHLTWEVVADEAITRQVLEVASGGGSFRTLAEVAPGDRSHSYTPKPEPNLQYRVSITFNNGRRYFSNTVALSNSVPLQKPQLQTTLVTANTLVIKSAGAYHFTVKDMAGRGIIAGRIVAGSSTVQLPQLAKGVYIIHFSNGKEQFSEKFLKQ